MVDKTDRLTRLTFKDLVGTVEERVMYTIIANTAKMRLLTRCK